MHPEKTRRAAHAAGWTFIGSVWLVTGVLGAALLFLLAILAYGLFAVHWSEDTLYAPRYTEAAFESVELGWDRAQVMERLGEPLAREPGFEGGERWSYTKSAESGYYWLRTVRFDDAGRVAEKVARFEFD